MYISHSNKGALNYELSENPVVVQIVHQSRDRLSLSLACTFPTKLCHFHQIMGFGETIDKWVVTC